MSAIQILGANMCDEYKALEEYFKPDGEQIC